MKTESESFLHFTLTAYHGELVGADPFIPQDPTLSQCLYDHFSCAPKEKPHSVLVWPKVNHTRRRFQYLGNYMIHRIGDYILIPKLGIGGAVQSTSADGKFVQLDHGYLYQQHHSKSSNYAQFLAASTKYLRQAKPSLTTDLVEAHITVALEIQRANTIQSWERICKQEGEIGQIKRWMISRLPDSSAEWVHLQRGHAIEIAEDGLIISKCTPVYIYQINWNRTFHGICYRNFPVQIYLNTSTFFFKFS